MTDTANNLVMSMGAAIAIVAVGCILLLCALIIFDDIKKIIQELRQRHSDRRLMKNIEEYRNDFA